MRLFSPRLSPYRGWCAHLCADSTEGQLRIFTSSCPCDDWCVMRGDSCMLHASGDWRTVAWTARISFGDYEADIPTN